MYDLRAAVQNLSKKLCLDRFDIRSQDFEYEFADPGRLRDYLVLYRNLFDELEKMLLMRMMLEAYNEYFPLKMPDAMEIWNEIASLLSTDYPIHVETLRYWACENDAIEDCFPIAPLVRKALDRSVGFA